MIIVKILSALLGIMFLSFGYFICFRKRFGLINGFAQDFKHGRKTEKYALKVGLIEFTVGAILLSLSAVLIMFA
ncbi:MAG: DUF3784 domain-containing protein [Eubacteriales bacterium]